jgi:hypothetical protein
MGLLSGLLLLPITGPVKGLQFIIEQIQEEAQAAMLDERRVQAELIDLSLRFDQGEMSEAEFEEREAALLERLNAIVAYKESLLDSTTYDYDDTDDDRTDA